MVGLVAGAMLVAGCSEPTTSDAPEATGSFPVTIEHVFGYYSAREA